MSDKPYFPPPGGEGGGYREAAPHEDLSAQVDETPPADRKRRVVGTRPDSLRPRAIQSAPPPKPRSISFVLVIALLWLAWSSTCAIVTHQMRHAQPRPVPQLPR